MNVKCLMMALVASAAILGAACSSKETSPAGASCSGSGDCNAGLECLDFALTPAGGGCSVVGKKCTKTCKIDDDCASIGSGYSCKAGCTAASATCVK